MKSLMLAALVVGGALAQCTQQSFGPGFTGANVETIIKRLEGLKPKSEFETTEEYQRRVGGDSQRLVVVVAKDPDTPPNVATPYGLDYSTAKYDADKEVLGITVSAGGSQMDDETYEDFQAFGLIYHSVKLPNYVGSNNFGVKRIIDNRSEHVYGLAWQKLETLPAYVSGLKPRMQADESLRLFSDNPDDYVFNRFDLKVSIPEARALKPFVRVALVVQVQPKVFHYSTSGNPTTSNPHDFTFKGAYLLSTLERVIVYDSRTGNYLKVSPPCHHENN